MASRKRDSDGAGPVATESQKPNKRVRKAINCDPCRASKLKCDRGRPCSGCILRDTTAQCYPDEERGPPPGDHKKEDVALSVVDVRTEIGRIRKSLAILEALVPREGSFSAFSSSSSFQGKVLSLMGQFDLTPTKIKEGGLYVGPTAPNSAVLTLRSDESGVTVPSESLATPAIRALRSPHSNADILSQIPTDFGFTTSLIRFFFSHTSPCPPINHKAFNEAWTRARQSDYTDHLVLSTVFLMLAIAMYYLPPGHPLLTRLPAPPRVVARRWYNASIVAANRYRKFKNPPDLDWIEMLLLKAQFLSICGGENEEIWGVKCELGTAAIAIALHRDPGAWKMDQDEIRRRRWAWWNYIVLERWQAFLFGRPVAIRPDHFDTKYPILDTTSSQVHSDRSRPPSSPASGQPLTSLSHLFALASFRLAVIVGEIVSDATSVKPVSYERVKEHDKTLEEWASALPNVPYNSGVTGRYNAGMNMGVSGVENLALFELKALALWRVNLRAQMFHVRFVLHRPYMNGVASNGVWKSNGHSTVMQEGNSSLSSPRVARGSAGYGSPPSGAGVGVLHSEGATMGVPLTTPSYEAAVHSADMVIQLVSDVSIQLLGQDSNAGGSMGFLGVPGHIAWIGYSLFSASVFFATVMLTQPYQLNSGSNTSSHYRRILSASHTLEHVKPAVPSAETALNVLYAMAPFFEDDLDDKGMKEQIKAIRTLPFPFHSRPPLPPHGKLRRSVVEELSPRVSRDFQLEGELEGMRGTTVSSEYDGDSQAPPPSQGLISPKSAAHNGVRATGLDNLQSISGLTDRFASAEPGSVYETPDDSVRAPSSMRSVSVVPATPYHFMPHQPHNSYHNSTVMDTTEDVLTQIGDPGPSHGISLNAPLRIETGAIPGIGTMPSLSGNTRSPHTFVVPMSPSNPSGHTASSAPPSFALPHPPADPAGYGRQNRSSGIFQRTDAGADSSGFGMGMAIGPGMGMAISQPKHNQPAQYIHPTNASLHHSGREAHPGYPTPSPSGMGAVAVGPSERDMYTGYRQGGLRDEVLGVGVDSDDLAKDWGSGSGYVW